MAQHEVPTFDDELCISNPQLDAQNEAERILKHIDDFRNAAYVATEIYEQCGRIGQFMMRLRNPDIVEQVSFVRAIRSVPEAERAAARYGDTIYY